MRITMINQDKRLDARKIELSGIRCLRLSEIGVGGTRKVTVIINIVLDY